MAFFRNLSRRSYRINYLYAMPLSFFLFLVGVKIVKAVFEKQKFEKHKHA
jgi:peptidoglycan biosynthesis protein MviN/MurJ (putative lipid II flippase)